MACKSVFVNFLIFSAVLISLTLAKPPMKAPSKNSSGVSKSENAVHEKEHVPFATGVRSGRQFYGAYPGFGGGNSFASASANAGSSGFGYPGFGNSASFANAQASSVGGGFGK